MLADYLSKLALDLHTTNKLLSKISHASNNKDVSKMLDGIVERLDKHTTQLEKIIDTASKNNS